MANLSDPSLVNYVRPEAASARPDLDLMSDLLAGTRRIWARALEAKYLRKWKDEDETVYTIRKESETVFEGLGRVLSACVGMLFAKPPQIVWNASEVAMQEHWQNLDGQGTAGPVLAKRFSDRALRDGLGLILVDHPAAPEGVVVHAGNEQELGLRPTWALYDRAQVLSWRTAVINNVVVLTQLVLEEFRREAAGAYGTADVRRYRVLRLVQMPSGAMAAIWELFRETKDTGLGGFVREGGGVYRNRAGQIAGALPVGIAYTGRTEAPLVATIPLLGVAWANLSHWRLAVALAFSREMASYAQGVLIGELAGTPGPNNTTIPGRIKVGPGTWIHLKGEGSSFEWKAPPIEAFEPLERGMQEKLTQLGQMGMSFMITDTRAAETATAKRLDATAENSTLATAAQGIQDAWNSAMEWHAWYLGIEKAGAPVMTINTDFDAVAIDPQTMSAYVDAVARAGLPPRLLLEAWQKGGRIPADADLDAIEREMDANRQAAEDAKAAEEAARAEEMNRRGGGAGAAQ